MTQSSRIANTLMLLFSRKTFPYLVLFLVYTSVFSLSYLLTELPAYEKNPLMDGNQYMRMLNYFSDATTEYNIQFPFNGRIIYIWIASLFSEHIDPIQLFIILNYIIGLATVCLLMYIWNKLSVPVSLSIFLGCYICIHWSGIIRQYMVDPVGVDIPYVFCLTLLLYMIVFDKYRYLIIVAIVGTGIKEAIIPFILCLFVVKIISKKILVIEHKRIRWDFSIFDNDMKRIIYALAACMIFEIILQMYFPPVQQGWKHTSIFTVLYCVYTIFMEPYHILDWMVGIILVFGVLLFPILKGFITIRSVNKKMELMLFTLLGLIMAIIGGGDHTRIAFLAFPFLLTYVALYLKEYPVSFSWVLYLIPSLYFTKCWLILPTATVNWTLYALWYPEYSTYKCFAAEAGICVMSIIALFLYTKSHTAKRPSDLS